MNSALLVQFISALTLVPLVASITCTSDLSGGSYAKIDVAGDNLCVLTDIDVEDITVSDRATLILKGRTNVTGSLLSTSLGEIQMVENSFVLKSKIVGGPSSNVIVDRFAHVMKIEMESSGHLNVSGTTGSVIMSKSGSLTVFRGKIRGPVRFLETTRSFTAVNAIFKSDVIISKSNSTVVFRNGRKHMRKLSPSIFGSISMTAFAGSASISRAYVGGNVSISGNGPRLNLFSSSIENLMTKDMFDLSLHSTTIRRELSAIKSTQIYFSNVNVLQKTNLRFTSFATILDTTFAMDTSITGGTTLEIKNAYSNGLRIAGYTTFTVVNGRFGENEVTVSNITKVRLKNINSISKLIIKDSNSCIAKWAAVREALFEDLTFLKLEDSTFNELYCYETTEVRGSNVTITDAVSGECVKLHRWF